MSEEAIRDVYLFLKRHGITESSITDSWARKALFFATGFPTQDLTADEEAFVRAYWESDESQLDAIGNLLNAMGRKRPR